MKTFLALSVLLISDLFCQDIYRIGTGLNIINPVGDFAEYSNTTTGLSFFSEYEIDENIIADVTVITADFNAKIKERNLNLFSVKKNIKSTSLLLGIQYKLFQNFYAIINGGMNYSTLPLEYYNYFNNTIEQKTKTEAYLMFGPGIIYRRYFTSELSLTVSANYSFVNGQFSNFNNFSLGTSIFLDLDL
jgi:hypothetical protein